MSINKIYPDLFLSINKRICATKPQIGRIYLNFYSGIFLFILYDFTCKLLAKSSYVTMAPLLNTPKGPFTLFFFLFPIYVAAEQIYVFAGQTNAKNTLEN